MGTFAYKRAIKLFILRLYVILAVMWRFLNTSIYGALCLAIMLYLFSYKLILVNPFNPVELVTWIIQLRHEYKAALITSFVTIIGFLIAFHASSSAARTQIKLTMLMKLCSDLSQFTYELNMSMNNIKIFAYQSLSLINSATNSLLTPYTSPYDLENIRFAIQLQLSKVPDLLRARDDFLRLQQIFISEFGSNYYLLSFYPKCINHCENVQSYLARFQESVWIPYPAAIQVADVIDHFVRNTPQARYQELVNVYCETYGRINASIGCVRGFLLNEITPPNVFSIFTLFCKSGKLLDLCRMLRSKGKEDNQKP